MSNIRTHDEHTARTSGAGMVDMKLEVVVVPVTDVERSKRFYGGLGWRLDADFSNDTGWRVVHMTPTGSTCSVMFGSGLTDVVPGSAQGLMLVVEDVGAARASLVEGGADVSDVFHFDGGLHVTGVQGRVSGPHPERQSYRSWASYSDPDGNGWLVQEVTKRLPGRGLSLDVATLTELLQEAERCHGDYEATAPKHHWSAWYAAYVVARERGSTPEEAARMAARSIADEPPKADVSSPSI